MSTRQGLSEFRDIELYLTAAGSAGGAAVVAPIDAFKAALEVVAKLEGQYAKLGSDVADLTGATILATGTVAHQIHVFTATTVMATGEYIMVYVETKPNADS